MRECQTVKGEHCDHWVAGFPCCTCGDETDGDGRCTDDGSFIITPPKVTNDG